MKTIIILLAMVPHIMAGESSLRNNIKCSNHSISIKNNFIEFDIIEPTTHMQFIDISSIKTVLLTMFDYGYSSKSQISSCKDAISSKTPIEEYIYYDTENPLDIIMRMPIMHPLPIIKPRLVTDTNP